MKKPIQKKTVPAKKTASKNTAAKSKQRLDVANKNKGGRPLKFPIGDLELEEYFVRSDTMEILGISETTFQKMEIPHSHIYRRAKLYKLSDVARRLYEIAKTANDGDEEITDSSGTTFTMKDERALRARAERIQAEMKNKITLREFLPKDEFTKVTKIIVDIINEEIGTLPLDLRADDPGLPASVTAFVDKKIASLKNRLSQIRPFKD